MSKPGKGSGKSAGSVGHDDETPGSGPDRRLPREPLGPYNRPFPVDGCPWDRRMWASERRKGKGKGKTTSAGLLEIMIDQLPMLTEKGLREMMVALSCELSFRGDVREQNEEVQLAHEASGGKGSAFPPEDLLEIVRSRGSRGDGHGEARVLVVKNLRKMNIESHQEKAIDTGMSMEKNSSMKIEPTWSMWIRAWFLRLVSWMWHGWMLEHN